MLVRLLPEQVSEQWEVIAPTIESSLPPMSIGSQMKEVLRAVLSEELVVWVYQPEGRAKAILTTTLYRDVVTRTDSVLIYTFYGLTELQISDYKNLLHTLSKFARGSGMRTITAFTNQPALASLLGRIGFSTDYILLTYEV